MTLPLKLRSIYIYKILQRGCMLYVQVYTTVNRATKQYRNCVNKEHIQNTQTVYTKVYTNSVHKQSIQKCIHIVYTKVYTKLTVYKSVYKQCTQTDYRPATVPDFSGQYRKYKPCPGVPNFCFRKSRILTDRVTV